jgi:hypothetical protein
MAKDIVLNDEGDLAIVSGDFVMGNSIDQEVATLLQLNKGEMKEHALLGPNLIELIHSNTSEIELKQVIKTTFKRDGKSYQDLKERIQLRND